MSTPKKKKIALVLAGGVSLGSYEAGVITELLYALETLNRTAEQEDRPKYELDVMTGGSAGGMTAVLTARIMMYNYLERKRDLYNAWVEMISIEKLLGDSTGATNALFSKKVIEDIIDELVVKGADQPASQPASFAPKTLRVSLSLSNMHGIKGSIPFLSMNSSEPEYFKTTFFSQMAHFTFQQKKLPSPEEWKSIGRAAIATGNFPIAFKPQLLSPKDLLYPYGNSEDEPKQCFIDGGLFNNEPLGEAISLARKADEHDPEPDRLFILIDPNMNEWRIKSDISPDDGLHKHIKRMGEMIFGESTARDWLRAHEKNTEIEWRDQLVQALGHLMKSDSFVPEQQFADEFKGIAEAIVTQKHVLESDEDPKQYLEESIAQTFQRSPFKEIAEDLGNSEKQDLFHHMVFVLNNLAGLQKKSKIRLDFIGADKEELAGDAARAFGGFFERDWRVYDYRIGRETAYAKLTEILGQSYPKEQSASGSGEHEDYVIKQEWRDKFPKVTAKDFNPDHLKELQTRILERADGVMKDLDVPGLFRWAVKRFVLKKHLKKFITNSE